MFVTFLLQRTWTEMELLPLVCLCLLTCSGTTFGDEVTKMRVKEDEDVILLCSLDSKDIRPDIFDWKTDDQKEVFLYVQGNHYNNGRGGQDPQFKGRVFHFEDQLQSGNASIEIRNTKVTDSGNYTCIFPNHQPTTRSIVELIVDRILKDRTKENIPGAALKPVITLHPVKEGVLLQCVVEGAFPKPKVVWKDGAGNILHAKEPEVTENKGRYNIILKTTVTKTDTYRCVSTQKEIYHEAETHVSVHVTKMGVKEDKDVILPCSLDSTNIQSETFYWKKDDQKEVFMYSAGSHYNNGRGGQDPQFKGRVFHFQDQLHSGNASIVIRNTKVTDSGNYTCIFPHHQPTIRSIIELIVGSCPEPSVTNLHQTDDQALLQCKVQGAFPKPKVQWLDSDNNRVPAGEPQVTESEGKFTIILKTTVRKSGDYRCVSTQEEICHQIHQKTEVTLQDAALKPTSMRVKEDEDVILPCSFGSTNIQSDTFDWKKDDQKNVFMYSSGSHYNNGRSGQDPQFKGRVFHFEDQLQSGNASIVIRNTKMTDSGNYTCSFPFHQRRTRSIIELIVDCILKDRTNENIPGAAPKPHVKIVKQTNGGVLLQCEVQGASPKPKVVWKDRAGKIVPAEEPEVTENKGRYNIILKTTVTKADNYRCVSTQEEIYHEVYSETYVFVPVSGSNTGWIVAFVIALVALVAVVVYFKCIRARAAICLSRVRSFLCRCFSSEGSQVVTNKPEEKNPDEKKPEDNKPEEIQLLPKGSDPVQQPPNGNNMSV